MCSWERNDNLQVPAIITSKAALALLIDECSLRCICGGVWEMDTSTSYDCGHVHIMDLRCKQCAVHKVWESSERYSDGTYELNRSAVASWLLVGGDGQHKYSAFMKQWGIGSVSRSAYYRHQQLFQEIVEKEALEEFVQVQTDENQRVIMDTQVPGSILKMDTQYTCQPKTGKQAFNATTTFMTGDDNKICGLYNVSLADLKKPENTENIKSLDKYATQMGLKDLCEKLEQIAIVVTDGCNSAAKSVRDIVAKHPNHQDVEVQKDVWHKSKNLIKKYKKWVATEDNSELQGDVPYEKIKKHFYYCSLNSFGNESTFKRLWMEAPTHWEVTKGLSDLAVEDLTDWMFKQWKCIIICCWFVCCF